MAEAIRAFRRAAESLAENRGLDAVSIAFVGPKKAGKTTLLAALIEDACVRAELKSGRRAAESTTRLTWVGSQRPGGDGADGEIFIPCSDAAVVPLGRPALLLDVPGFDEIHADRAAAARTALDAALVKVLVVARHQIETQDVITYLGRTDGAAILPVVNLAGDADAAGDAEMFVAQLREALPASRVLDPVVVPDFEAGGTGAEEVLLSARDAMVGRLRPVLAALPAVDPAGPQLAARARQFRHEVAALARRHLPAVARELDVLDRTLDATATSVMAGMLGDDRTIERQLKLRFRAVLLDRTPGVFFPWRITLSAAVLTAGAADRVALAALGSLPSLVSSAWTAAKNVKDAAEFSAEMESGLRRRITARFAEAAAPAFEQLEMAFRRDLQEFEEAAEPGVSGVELCGIETAQDRSSELFRETVEAYAPRAPLAIGAASLGTLIFWGILGWPVYALYHDFAAGARTVLSGGDVSGFPAPAGALILTSVLLAWLPMFLFLLAVVAFATRRGRVRRALGELRGAHRAEMEKLLEAGLLRPHPRERRIRAARQLLRFDFGAGAG
jgi:molybdopterin-guanine dinucleotide biosynthesis protein